MSKRSTLWLVMIALSIAGYILHVCYPGAQVVDPAAGVSYRKWGMRSCVVDSDCDIVLLDACSCGEVVNKSAARTVIAVVASRTLKREERAQASVQRDAIDPPSCFVDCLPVKAVCRLNRCTRSSLLGRS